jgi:DNA-binding response OmpR family regulator
MVDSSDSTVLVVEDEPGLADTYAEGLSEEYDVRTAYSGSEALDYLDDDVAVCLLDRRLPDSSADELLETIDDRCPGCPVALVTGVTPDFDILEMEFDAYVVKPVTNEELRDTVDRVLARSDYEQLLREYFTLISKYAALRTHKTDAELEASPEFSDLETEIEEVRREIEALVANFDAEDFRALCHDLA